MEHGTNKEKTLSEYATWKTHDSHRKLGGEMFENYRNCIGVDVFSMQRWVSFVSRKNQTSPTTSVSRQHGASAKHVQCISHMTQRLSLFQKKHRRRRARFRQHMPHSRLTHVACIFSALRRALVSKTVPGRQAPLSSSVVSMYRQQSSAKHAGGKWKLLPAARATSIRFSKSALPQNSFSPSARYREVLQRRLNPRNARRRFEAKAGPRCSTIRKTRRTTV